LPATENGLFDAAVRKALGIAVAALEGAAQEEEGKRDFALYEAIRKGTASLQLFDEPDAVDHLINIAIDVQCLPANMVQHAVMWGMRDAEEAREKQAKTRANGHALPFIDKSGWDAMPPEREWAVLGRIPLRQPTLFSGEGSTGKSIIALQLCIAHAMGSDWLGAMPTPGPAVYFGAEDEQDELQRRCAAIASFYSFSLASMTNLNLLSFAGLDPVLAMPTREGKIVATPLFDRLMEAAGDIKPRCLVLDTSADVYGGNEIDRTQVRAFVNMLRKLAITADGSVVLLAHPSLTGINSGSGISGSTAWHNSVRARMYLKVPKDEDDNKPSDRRELQFLKNNYGPVAETLTLQWKNGLFLPENSTSPLHRAANEANADAVFLAVLGKLIQQKRTPSPKCRAPNYAPTVIAKHQDGKGHSKKEYETAMERLIEAGKIYVEESGAPSRKYHYLAIGPQPEDASNE
jgi:RecA-family ATPase